MRLLTWNDQNVLSLTSNLYDEKIPQYAILSHTWGDDRDEVTLADIHQGQGQSKAGYKKIVLSGEQARKDGIQYFWVDTCCIDKTSSAELTEAINSMYKWYEAADFCYVYLHDVGRENWQETFHKSRWFTRGWTLQELLAPRAVIFYDCQWQVLGDKANLADRISLVTGMAMEALETRDLTQYSIAQRMAWAAKRVTSRAEDRAYCLMGLFSVNMPLLYGEGERAFLRLQEEIIKYSDDHSIFAWSIGEGLRFSGLLAPHPRCFAECQNMVSDIRTGSRESFSMTNRGLSIKLEITPWSLDTYLAYLDCATETGLDQDRRTVRVGIFLRRLGEDDQYVRTNPMGKSIWFDTDNPQLLQGHPTRHRQLFLRHSVIFQLLEDCYKDRVYGFEIPKGCLPRFTRVIASDHTYNHRVLTLRSSTWGCVTEIDLPAQKTSGGLRKIALGFDFEFNPVCLLEDSFLEPQHQGEGLTYFHDWSVVLTDDMVWDEIIEGSRVYRKTAHDGRWALKGHRLRGLDVLLSAHLTDGGSFVTFKRHATSESLLWEFNIDNLVGPFRAYSNEANLQEAQELGIAGDVLEQGEELPREPSPMIGCIEPSGTP